MAKPNGGTNLGSGYGPVECFLTNTSGNMVNGSCTAANLPTSTDGYAVGCTLRVTDTGQIYVNTGTTTASVFTLLSAGSGVHPVKAAINATGTATAAQVATGYITSTSAAATAITLPSGTLLGGVLGATQGTTLDLYVDNTAGANTVTMVVAANGILSAAAAANAASFGLLTIPSGVTGMARFTIMFSSATAYTFTRTA